MANEESFILLSLKEKKSKQLAQVISSDKCRVILEYMSSKDFATETDIANDLKLPLSTVHYNIKALHDSGMIACDEFHYSKKGKEVPHYKLANKFIIIAPKNEPSTLERLKKFIPIGAIILGLGAAFSLGSMLLRSGGTASFSSADMAAKSAPRAVDAGGEAVLMAADEAFVETATITTSQAVSFPWLHVILAFIAGVALTALTIFLWKKYSSRKHKN